MTSNRLVLTQYRLNWEETGVPACRHWESLFAVSMSQLKLVFFRLSSDGGIGPSECRSNSILVSIFPKLIYFIFFLLLMSQRDQPPPAAAFHCCNFPQMTPNEGATPPHHCVSEQHMSLCFPPGCFLLFFNLIPLFLPFSQQHLQRSGMRALRRTGGENQPQTFLITPLVGGEGGK